MRTFTTILLLLISGSVFSQLSCRETEGLSGGIKRTCLHQNGVVSTVEEWDAAKSHGTVAGYDAQGNEIFAYPLRRFAGHASITLSYHSNGQVSRMHFSDAPDGGIQYYRITCSYAEDGSSQGCSEEEYPPRLDNWTIKGPPVKIEQDQEIVVQEVAVCGAPCMSVYEVVNTTRKRVRVHLTPVPNLWRTVSEKEFILRSKKSVEIDSILMADLYFSPDTFYRIDVHTKRKRGPELKISDETIQSSSTRRIYRLQIVRD